MFGGPQLSGDLMIPDGITELEDGAFVDTAIRSVTLPSTLRIIGSAFTRCRQLTTVTIREGVTEIGMVAFHQTAIRSLALPSTIKTIGSQAFSACTQLTTVTIPSSVRSITFERQSDPFFDPFHDTALNAASQKALTDRGYRGSF
jgi:hypothetical protein